LIDIFKYCFKFLRKLISCFKLFFVLSGDECNFLISWILIHFSIVACFNLQEALESISNETNDKKILATVSGFLRRLSDFDFYFCLILCHSIFEKTDILKQAATKDNGFDWRRYLSMRVYESSTTSNEI